MSIDLAGMLQRSIQYRTQYNYDHQIAMRPEESLRIAYVTADVELGKLVNLVGWSRPERQTENNNETLLKQYITVLDAMFQVAAKQTWSHLIVMSEGELAPLTQKQPAKSLSQQFLSINHFLDQSLFDRRQDAFKHAWHLIIKLGVVDLKLSGNQIEAGYIKQYN